MHIDDIKRGLRAEIKARENEQYATFQCNVRQMCKDVLAKLEEQESVIAELKDRRLQRSLWLARAARANDKQTYYTHIRGDGWVHSVDKWINVERLCLAKADQFKEDKP